MPQPPIVRQECLKSCWAACMRSIGFVSPYIEVHSQAWYITQWGEGYPSGGLDYHSEDFQKFRNYFGYLYTVVPAGGVTEDMVRNWLRYDYFVFVERQSSGCHARVGIRWDDSAGGIKVMDPAPTKGILTLFPCDLDQVAVVYF